MRVKTYKPARSPRILDLSTKPTNSIMESVLGTPTAEFLEGSRTLPKRRASTFLYTGLSHNRLGVKTLGVLVKYSPLEGAQ